MSKSIASLLCSLAFLLPFLSDAGAAAYKCIDANGDVTYSQTPCKRNQKTDKTLENGQKRVEVEDCQYAGAFSQMTFGHMRSGLSMQQLFDRYGGVSSISPGTLGVINYVYSFKYATDMQPGRLAELTVARCKAQAFGRVACEDFPREFEEMIFSCDEEERKEALRLQKLIGERTGQPGQFDNSAIIGGYGSTDSETRNQERIKTRESNAKKREEIRIAKCKKRYETQIENIDERMSRAYTASQGESFRDRRRELVKKLASECR